MNDAESSRKITEAERAMKQNEHIAEHKGWHPIAGADRHRSRGDGQGVRP